jgi:hypothetical protein
MKRLDDRTVELNSDEELVHEIFETMLDRGFSMTQAINNLTGNDVPEGLRSKAPRLNKIMTPEFVSWLIN